jgi:hypothetical protein
MSNQQHQNPAKKILCIGGSTYNPGTIKDIQTAFDDSNFLNEWAVVVAIHDYYVNYDSAKVGQRQKEWANFNCLLLSSGGCYILNQGSIYIFPDSGMMRDETSPDWVTGELIINNNWLEINMFLKGQTSFNNIDSWLLANNNLSDSLGNERNYLPWIDKVMQELANIKSNLTEIEIAGLILCGLDGDGAYGLQEIKKQGGHTAVQAPNECWHPDRDDQTSSMPKAALQLDSTHQRVSLPGNTGKNGVMSLTDWLKSLP